MAISALEQATENAYKYLKARRHEARSHCFLDLQGKIPRGDPRRDAEIKKLTAAELGPDGFVQELKMMAVSSILLVRLSSSDLLIVLRRLVATMK